MSPAEQALVRAEGHLASGDIGAAESAYFEAAREAAEHTSSLGAEVAQLMMRARIGLGRVELRREAPNRALGWFLSAQSIGPNDWRPRYWQGCAQGWLGDHAGAEHSFTVGLRLEPREPSLRVQRSCARLKQGDLRAALADQLAAGGSGLDAQVLHAISRWWLRGGHEAVSTQTAIAAMVTLLHHEGLWERFRSSAASRYQVQVQAQAIAECRAELWNQAQVRLSQGSGGRGLQPTDEALSVRETAAASALRDLGGLPLVDSDDPLVCGPLMIALLGRQRALGDFVARVAPGDESQGDEPWPGARTRIRLLFSGLGVTLALLDAERPQESVAALAAGACRRCRLAAEPGSHTPVCVPDCPDRDDLHPGYASIDTQEDLLAQDAARLSVVAKLAAARQVLAADGGDADTAAQLWRGALETATGGATTHAQHEVAETVLGRTKVLRRENRLSDAIELAELSLPLLRGAPAHDEVSSELSEVLTDRGVQAGNAEHWDDCLNDLRRGTACNPHAARPRINLSLALQRLATERCDRGDRTGAVERLREALHILRDDSSVMSHNVAVGRQLAAVEEELRSLRNGWAVGLAAEGAFEDALGVLEEGLTELPADATLRNSQRNVFLGYAMRLRDHGQPLEALEVLERGLRALPADVRLSEARARLDSGGGSSR